jgi:pyruvate/oxaloacetate carboxyltransferase
MIGLMTLTLAISAEAEAKLIAKAAAAGVDVATFAARTLERAACKPTLEEVLAPLRGEFERSGMSEEELTELLETAKHEARAERRARRAS